MGRKHSFLSETRSKPFPWTKTCKGMTDPTAQELQGIAAVPVLLQLASHLSLIVKEVIMRAAATYTL